VEHSGWRGASSRHRLLVDLGRERGGSAPTQATAPRRCRGPVLLWPPGEPPQLKPRCLVTPGSFRGSSRRRAANPPRIVAGWPVRRPSPVLSAPAGRSGDEFWPAPSAVFVDFQPRALPDPRGLEETLTPPGRTTSAKPSSSSRSSPVRRGPIAFLSFRVGSRPVPPCPPTDASLFPTFFLAEGNPIRRSRPPRPLLRLLSPSISPRAGLPDPPERLGSTRDR